MDGRPLTQAKISQQNSGWSVTLCKLVKAPWGAVGSVAYAGPAQKRPQESGEVDRSQCEDSDAVGFIT